MSDMLANMGKKNSKLHKQSRMITQQGKPQNHCPYCGLVNQESAAVSLMDQLSRSHFELCASLRLAGRQMLRFEKQDDESLERIRKVLKRADNIRGVLQRLDESGESPKAMDEDELADASSLASQYTTDQVVNEVAIRKSVQRKNRLTRPRSLRVIRFPTS
jgi:hypothetical protein